MCSDWFLLEKDNYLNIISQFMIPHTVYDTLLLFSPATSYIGWIWPHKSHMPGRDSCIAPQATSVAFAGGDYDGYVLRTTFTRVVEVS